MLGRVAWEVHTDDGPLKNVLSQTKNQQKRGKKRDDNIKDNKGKELPSV